MNKSIVAAFFCMLLSACAVITEQPEKVKRVDDLAPFPVAESGYIRHVINLPKREKENEVRVELLVGRTMQVDCNIHKLAGSINKKELAGWGYSYYFVRANLEIGSISTRMGCTDRSTRSEFVIINNELNWIRYNSNLPIVVYAPRELQVKYRFWTREDTLFSVTSE